METSNKSPRKSKRILTAKWWLDWLNVISSGAKVLFVCALVCLIWWHWKTIIALATRYSVTNVKALGVELQMVSTAEKRVVAANAANRAPFQIAFRRIERVAGLFKDKRFMWLDDNLSNNELIIGYFESLGVDIRTEGEANQAGQNSFYGRFKGFVPHLLIMDTTRPGDSNETVIAKLRTEFGFRGPIIIYSSTPRPLPEGAQAYVSNFWELLHVVCDQVERIESARDEENVSSTIVH